MGAARTSGARLLFKLRMERNTQKRRKSYLIKLFGDRKKRRTNERRTGKIVRQFRVLRCASVCLCVRWI